MELKINNLCFSYGKEEVLKDISFTGKSGEIICILGPNGAGKTTLLKCINKIIRPSSGLVSLDGQDLAPLSREKMAKIFSYVPQTTYTAFPMRVIDTILMGRSSNISFRIPKEDRDRAYEIIDRMNLSHLAFKDLNQLSGGERQRVLIGKAIAQESSIILLDEPTSALDIKNQIHTLSLIEDLVVEKKLMVIMTIHDLNLATMYGDQALFLKDSRVYDFGPIEAMLDEEKIREVYGIDNQIESIGGFKRVIVKKK